MREARELEAALRRPRPSRQPQGRLENRLMEMADYDGTSHGGRFKPLTEEELNSEEEPSVKVRSQVAAPEEREGAKERPPYGCPHCEEIFTRKDNLQRHVENYHQGSPDRKSSLRCAKCGKYFSRKDVRDRHYQKCQGPKGSKEKKGSQKRTSETVLTEDQLPVDKKKIRRRRRRGQKDGQASSDADPQVSGRGQETPAAASHPALATAKSQVGRGLPPRVDGSEQGRRSSEAAATPSRAHASAHPHPDLAMLARSEEQARVGTSTPPARQVRLSPKGTPGDPGYEVIAPGDEDREAIDDGAETEGAEEPAEEPETVTTGQDEGGDPPRVVVLAEDPDVSVVSEQYLGLESPTVKDTINLSPSLIGQMLPAMPAKQAKMGPVTDAVGQIVGEQPAVTAPQETTGATVATTAVTVSEASQ